MEINTKKNIVLDREEIFHDNWADSINIDDVIVDELFEASTSPENRIIIKKIGDIKDKKILELGCGAGEASVYFAKKGAKVTAIDISKGMLEVVHKVAQKHKVSLSTKQSYSDNIDCADETFDIVYASNLLHHVNILDTLKEVTRVLKKGGLFVSWDPIAHNPMINIYRRMATNVRTADEHPIKMKQLKLFSKYFSNIETEVTWLFTLWIFVKFYFIDKIHPNEERYWKKILTEHKKLETIYYNLEKLDKFVLKFLPFLKRYCWNIVIIAKK
jgi:ubiquinone/menaquinone biosynthesis C-methylase UbiE